MALPARHQHHQRNRQASAGARDRRLARESLGGGPVRGKLYDRRDLAGIVELASGGRRDALGRWFAGADRPRALFRDRVLPFAKEPALEWGRIMAEGSRVARPRSPLDMIIAATAAANRCIVVTANGQHFRDVIEFVNPVRVAV